MQTNESAWSINVYQWCDSTDQNLNSNFTFCAWILWPMSASNFSICLETITSNSLSLASKTPPYDLL